MAKRWIAGLVAATWLVAGCSSNGGTDADTTTTKAKAAETTTTSPDAAAGKEFQALAETTDGAIDDEATTRDDFAAQNDLDGAIDSTRDLRNDLFDFDAAVRALDISDEHASEVNDVLTATGRYIEELDAFLDLTDIPAYNDQLDAETTVRDDWTTAVNALADSLGTDGIGTEDLTGDDTTTTTTTDDEVVEAGGTVTDGTLSMEVPKGFTGSDGATIQMEHESGATLGIYSVYPETATTLEAVAKESAEGAADKNGDVITAGPEDLEVGDFKAIGYSSKAEDGTLIVDIYFDTEVDADNRFRVITVEVAAEDIDTVMSAVEAAAPSLKLN